MIDVGDEEQVAEAQAKAKLLKERETEELRHILGLYGGRAFVWRILEYCGLYRSPSSEDILRETGRADVARYLLEEMFVSDKDAYTKMRNEAEERILSND